MKLYEIESNRKKHNLEDIAADGECGELSEIIWKGPLQRIL
jgi:hypothetical protein